MLMFIACLSMLIDHIGILFFPHITLLRIIGRLAMPIYAYFIATGYKNTSDIHKYIKRVAMNALISQIPYALMAGKSLNVCFTWFISLVLIYSIDKKKWGLGFTTFIMAILTWFYVPFDYGFYGIATAVVFHIRNAKRDIYDNLIMFLGIIAIFLLMFLLSSWIAQLSLLIAVIHLIRYRLVETADFLQSYALLSIPIILISEKYNLMRTNDKSLKLIYRYFYPLHMVILELIKYSDLIW